MNNTYTNQKEIDQSGWWAGSIYVNQSSIGDESLDMEHIDHYQHAMIHNILRDWEPKDDVGGIDVVSVSWLREDLREQVEKQIADGNDYGIVWDDGEEISWNLDIDCTLEGRKVDWWDLSDASRDHIAHGIIEDFWKQGEICELGTREETIVFDEISKGGNTRGEFRIDDYDGESITGTWEWEREAGAPILIDLESIERSYGDQPDEDNSLGGLETAEIESLIEEAVAEKEKELSRDSAKSKGRGF